MANQYYVSEQEGRNTGPDHPREQRPVKSRQGVPYYGYTLQRIKGDADIDPQQRDEMREYPKLKIANEWWFNELLPQGVFNKEDDNGVNLHRGIHKTGPHLPDLERATVVAPTKQMAVGRDGVARRILANARPLYLYEKKNTLDRPADEKKCAYGKIRDPTTNSWRCIKNPNHHASDTRQMH